MEYEKLSVVEIIKRMTITQLVYVISLLLCLLGGGFTVGMRVQSLTFDREKFELLNENTRLKKEIGELKSENKKLKNEIESRENNFSSKSDSCSLAKIVSPEGSPDKVQAIRYVVPKIFRIFWNPSDCIMDVEYWNNSFHEKFINKASGNEINIPHSGITQLKIWHDNTISHEVWVSVK